MRPRSGDCREVGTVPPGSRQRTAPASTSFIDDFSMHCGQRPSEVGRSNERRAEASSGLDGLRVPAMQTVRGGLGRDFRVPNYTSEARIRVSRAGVFHSLGSRQVEFVWRGVR
jgi:hypothetical protein